MKLSDLKRLQSELREAEDAAARDEGRLQNCVESLEVYGVTGLMDLKTPEDVEKALRRGRKPLNAKAEEAEAAFREAWTEFATEFPELAAKVVPVDEDEDEDE